jgi:hypothetical protein
MKKLFAVATSLALTLVMVLPGMTAAVPLTFGALDQSADRGSGSYALGESVVVQTVTPAKTGSLSRIEVYCDWSLYSHFRLSVASASVDLTCYSSGWLTFAFESPLPTVVAGQQFSMTVTSPDPHWGMLGLADSDYPGGALTADGQPLPSEFSDLAFRTYVIESPVTTYAWSQGSVPAGVSTPVTLNATINYPELAHGTLPSVAIPAAQLLSYVAKFDALPSWFTPTGVTCSAQIVPGECQLDKLSSGMAVAFSYDPMTVTVAIAGIAAPPASATGSGSASGSGCIHAGAFDSCGNAQAVLGIGAAVTPPISSTSSESAPASSSGMPVVLLLVGGFASVMAALAAVMVRRSRS